MTKDRFNVITLSLPQSQSLAKFESAKSALRISLMFAVLILLQLAISVVSNANAQTISTDTQQRINVYSVWDQQKIAEVPASTQYRVIAEQGNKKRVEFLRPTVSGWVSARFVDIDQIANSAKVNADVLNFRRGPNVSSPRLTQVYEGYQSTVLGSENGFVKILAPTSWQVLIDSVVSESSLSSTAIVPVKSDTVDSDEVSVEEITANKKETQALTSEVPATQLVEENHLLAPGDSISLQVFGESDLSISNVRVPQNGRVSFPLIGSVAVLGKTTIEVEDQVRALLSQGYVRNPRLSVSIFSYRPIFIRGEVNSLGSFPYAEGLTVAKAIALAGGLKKSAKIDGVSITRDGQIVAEGLSADSRVIVASGDIVSVDADQIAKQAESSYVFLHGEVAQTGAYEFRKGLTVEKAVVLAGGFTLRASRKKINISRYDQIAEGAEPTELKRVKLYTPVKPGDVIKVGASWF